MIDPTAESRPHTSAGNPQIDAWFTYHAPTPDQRAAMEEINARAADLAYAIDRNCPASADKSAAFRLVREARMTANAAIVVPVIVPTPR